MKTIWLNPFEKYSEKRLLLVGTIITLAGSLVAAFFKARFDGVLDLHFVEDIIWWEPLADNLANIFSLAIILFLAAIIINKKTRFVDVLAASIVARIPYYMLPVFNINNFMNRAGAELVDPETMQLQSFDIADLIPVFIFGIFSLSILVWYLLILYQGFRVASNAKGAVPIILFIISIIVAEIISKIIIIQYS